MIIKRASATKGAIAGGALGAGLNALRQHRANKKDPGNKKSLLGAAAKGGAGGAILGGGAGAVKGKMNDIKREVQSKSRKEHNQKMKDIDRKHDDLMESIKKGNKALNDWDNS